MRIHDVENDFSLNKKHYKNKTQLFLKNVIADKDVLRIAFL